MTDDSAGGWEEEFTLSGQACSLTGREKETDIKDEWACLK